MELLPALERLGLPGWLMSIAAVVIILHYTGVIQWVTERLTDQQEHSQSSQEKRETFAALQESWREDKISTLLEENESFIRERVWDQLKVIGEKLARLEMTVAQVRDVITTLTRELYELRKKIGRDDDDN